MAFEHQNGFTREASSQRSKHQAPSTKHQAPSTKHQELSTADGRNHGNGEIAVDDKICWDKLFVDGPATDVSQVTHGRKPFEQLVD